MHRPGSSLWISWAIIILVVELEVGRALMIPATLVKTGIAAVAGSAGALASYPIDYVKSQLQTEEGRKKYKGGIDAAFIIMNSSRFGPFALYRGAAVQVIGSAPEKSVKLGANNFFKIAIQTHLGYLPLIGEIAAGALAGMTQIIVTNPTEVIKIKMQTTEMTFKEVLKEVKGLSGLFQGADACMARDVVFTAILFPTYSHTSHFLQTTVDPTDSLIVFLANLAAGSVAAVPAAILATPPDVVKTRIQSTTSSSSSSSHSSFFQVTSQIFRHEGPSVLFSGWLERSVRSVPQLGVTLAMFDVLNSYASNRGWI